MNKEKIYKAIFVFIILTGICLRFTNLYGNTVFDWDQENSVSFKAREIITDRHFSLIGARTGVGDLYLGPLYNYTSAFFYFIVSGNPVAGPIQAGVFSIMSAVLGFFLAKKYFGNKQAFYFLVFYLVSPFILKIDRIPWNLNIFAISSLFVIYGLLSLTDKDSKKGFILLGLGFFIGLNSHFSSILLIISSIIYLFVRKKTADKRILFPILGIIIGILPLVIFNLRHGSILKENTGKFINENITGINLLPEKFITSSLLISNLFGKLFLAESDHTLSAFIYIAILAFFVRFTHNKYKEFYLIFLIFILIFLFGSAVFSGSTPEYYFSALFPLILILYALIASVVESVPGGKAYIIFVCLLMLFKSYSFVSQDNPQSLGNKMDIVSQIKNQTNGSVRVIYNMDLDWSYGYRYLFDYYNVRIDDNKKDNTFIISYPAEKASVSPDYTSGKIALNYPATVKKIYDTKQVEFYDNLFKMRLPKEWVVLRCPSVDFDKYYLSPDQGLTCSGESSMFVLLIENAPDCNIWEMNPLVPLKIDSAIPIYLIPLYKTPAISFEKNRCIKFSETAKEAGNDISMRLLELLGTLKK